MTAVKPVEDVADPVAISNPRGRHLRAVGSSDQAGGPTPFTISAPLTSLAPSLVSGAAITVVDDGQRVAPLVAGLLQSHGATAQVVGPEGIPETSDGIIHLGQLHSGSRTASDLFKDVYPVAKAGATTVLTVTGHGGTRGQYLRDAGHDGVCGTGGGLARVSPVGQLGRADQPGRVEPRADWIPPTEHAGEGDRTASDNSAGQSGSDIGSLMGELAGLLGELAEELPGANVRAVDLDCSDDPVVLAGRIVAEALVSGGPVAIGYCDDRRCTLVPAAEPILADSLDPQMIWGRTGMFVHRPVDPGLLLIG
jgi:hypothetical protein